MFFLPYESSDHTGLHLWPYDVCFRLADLDLEDIWSERHIYWLPELHWRLHLGVTILGTPSQSNELLYNHLMKYYAFKKPINHRLFHLDYSASAPENMLLSINIHLGRPVFLDRRATFKASNLPSDRHSLPVPSVLEWTLLSIRLCCRYLNGSLFSHFRMTHGSSLTFSPAVPASNYALNPKQSFSSLRFFHLAESQWGRACWGRHQFLRW